MIGLGLAGALSAIVALVALQASRPPAWWAAAGADAGPEGADLAERVERAVVAEAHRARPEGEPWSVAITAEQANAWLAHRLPKWMANRARAGAPAPLPGDVRVRFAEGRVEAARRAPGERAVIGASVEIVTTPDGSTFARDPRFRVGRLSAPARWLAGHTESMDGATREALEILGGRRPLAPPGGLALDDGRILRLLGVRVERGRLVATCETRRER